MELINQHTKKIMEECKARAREAGLSFGSETLEYIVTNRDMIRLSPKNMIPTLYDYWVNDVEVLREEGKYRLYPHNPYETVINSRPAISFYNDNNPDWLNIMIFYHVLAHIDFFQNNIFFENTWNDDFVGVALADKRHIESLRSEHGRWVDYVIEFGRALDNITGYFSLLPNRGMPGSMLSPPRFSFYTEVFLQEMIKVPAHEVFREIDRFNSLLASCPDDAEEKFFAEVSLRYPEFSAKYEQSVQTGTKQPDILAYVMEYSPFLAQPSNRWMKSVLSIVRNTALYFAPQIRTKILNEGWASYWHDELFRSDPRISGHETDYARINAGVTSISRIGLNPYAIGMRLVQYVEELSETGKLNIQFSRIGNAEQRASFNRKTGQGKQAIFELRKYFSDYMLVNTFIDQDFTDKHRLFTVGQRVNEQKGTTEYYIKSRKAEDYRTMIVNSLYHPPFIEAHEYKTTPENLYLIHHFEGKPLYMPYIQDTLAAIGYLWGGQVQIETSVRSKKNSGESENAGMGFKRVLFTFRDKKITQSNL